MISELLRDGKIPIKSALKYRKDMKLNLYLDLCRMNLYSETIEKISAMYKNKIILRKKSIS
jgi:hypothetical protein